MGEQKKPEDGQVFLLNKPGIQLPKHTSFFSFFYYAVLLSLAGAGAMGCFFTAFQIPLDLFPLLAAGAVCAFFCSVQFLLGRWKWPAALAAALLWGILLWRNFADVSQGCLRTLSIALGAYEGKLSLTLPHLAVSPIFASEEQRLCTLFAQFLQLPFFWILSWLIVHLKSSLGAFAWTGIFLLIPLAPSIMPAPWALAALILFWAFLLLAAPSMRHESHFPEERKKFRITGASFFQPSSLLLLPVIALSMLLVYRAFPPDTFERPKFVNEIRSGLTEGVNLPALLRGGTGSGGSQVNLATLGERNYTGKTALQTRHQWENGKVSLRKDYLKSFVGSVYTGTSWEPLSQEDAGSAASALAGQKAQTLSADLAQTLPFEGDLHPSYTLSVRKRNVDSRSIYSPYGLSLSDEVPQDITYVDDGFLKSSRLFSGPKDYSLPAVILQEQGTFFINRFSAHADAVSSSTFIGGGVSHIYEGSSSGSQFTIISGESSADHTQADAASYKTFLASRSYADQLYDELENALLEDPSLSPDQWKLPDWAKELVPEETAQALTGRVENYSSFVYDHYTRLPGNLRDFLVSYRAQHNLSLPEYDSGAVRIRRNGQSRPEAIDPYLEYAEQVRSLLAEQCSYTLAPPTLPQGRDFVEYFLGESKRGYCVHFATAAVALLRSAGIPARYAEGYVVPVSPEEEWVDVPDYNAHAWVEIYWGGAGWTPFEVTPAGPEAPAAYPDAIGLAENGNDDLSLSGTSSMPDRPNPAEAPEIVSDVPAGSLSPSPSPTAPGGSQRQSKQEKGWLDHFLAFLSILGTAALPFFLIWLLRFPRLGWRKLQFRQKDRNKAALRVYAHLLRLYKENYVLPYGGTSPPEEIEQLALKARFSNHVLTEEELGRLTSLADSLEKRLDGNLSKYSRLRCKYLLALF